MNRAFHYKILIVGIVLTAIGLVLSPIAKEYSLSRGGADNTTKLIDDHYYLVNKTGENIEISKKEYIVQNILDYTLIISFLLGFFLVFVFFILSMIYRVVNRTNIK